MEVEVEVEISSLAMYHSFSLNLYVLLPRRKGSTYFQVSTLVVAAALAIITATYNVNYNDQ